MAQYFNKSKLSNLTDLTELPPPDGWPKQHVFKTAGRRNAGKEQAQVRAQLIPLYAERYAQHKDIFNGQKENDQESNSKKDR